MPCYRDLGSLSRQARQGSRPTRRKDQEPDPRDQLGRDDDPSTSRPGERRDPYAAASRLAPGQTRSATIDAGGYGSRRSPGRPESLIRTTETPTMSIADKLVLQRQHHLKWRAFDRLELSLMMLCGLLCFGFSPSVASGHLHPTNRPSPPLAAGGASH